MWHFAVEPLQNLNLVPDSLRLVQDSAFNNSSTRHIEFCHSQVPSYALSRAQAKRYRVPGHRPGGFVCFRLDPALWSELVRILVDKWIVVETVQLARHDRAGGEMVRSVVDA